MFGRSASIPCCYYLEIISIFASSSLQDFVTCKASIQLFTGTIFLEIKITAFFLLSNDHLHFCFSWPFTEPLHYIKLFFKMWASISCLLGNCCFFADNFCTPIFILCGFICCDNYFIWGDLWCHFQILYRNGTPFSNFISLIWCKLSLCQTAWITPPWLPF